eukprot:6868186-Pyramimonas_sp.AAC.1
MELYEVPGGDQVDGSPPALISRRQIFRVDAIKFIRKAFQCECLFALRVLGATKRTLPSALR